MQKITSFKRFLTEVAMAPNQWTKPNGQTGEARLDILQRLIQSHTPIELEDGDKIVITQIKDALAAITKFKSDGKRFELVGKVDGKGKEVMITSSDIKNLLYSVERMVGKLAERWELRLLSQRSVSMHLLFAMCSELLQLLKNSRRPL